MRNTVLVAMMVLPGVAGSATAQEPVGCDYAHCSLGILPRLTGLDVVRGTAEHPVVSLGFLQPRDVRAAFQGSGEAERHAGSATMLRRAGAVFTAMGLASLATGAVRGAISHDRIGSAAFASAGAALFLVSVPIHFAADAELSRAVWEYNRRFTR